MLLKLFEDAEYVTLDRIALAEEAEENPARFLNRFHGRVIIDEIQYAPSLFPYLKIKVDEDRTIKGKWVLTGSQQFALMQKVSVSLVWIQSSFIGRKGEILLHLRGCFHLHDVID